MAIRKFRYGVAVPMVEEVRKPIREDRPTPRLLTRISFGRSLTGIGQFRVLAEGPQGTEVLVCLGATRDEALEAARALVGDLPNNTQRLRLEQWQGGTCAGRWQRLSCRQGELPTLPGRRLRRRKGRSQMY